MKTAKELSEKAISIVNDATKSIIELMTEKNVALISFVTNGDHSDFDIDRAYVFLEDKYGIVSEQEIVAIYTDGKALYILPDSVNIPSSVLDNLSEGVFFDSADGMDANVFNDLWRLPDSFFNPTDTMIDLLVSVEEAMDLYDDLKDE